MQAKATTGLTEDQFNELYRLISDQFIWHSGKGRSRCLNLREALEGTLMYFKANVTEEFVATQFGTTQPTISRMIREVEVMITEVLGDWVPDLREALRGSAAVIDGSLLPCWSWAGHPELYSGKHKTTGHNCQVVVDLAGRLVHMADPLPGVTHDAKALDESGIPEKLDLETAVADKGYQGKGAITPKKKPRGGELADADKKYNAQVNRIRYVVERAIANIKIWRILHTDYRRPLSTFKTAFTALRALIFFTQSFE